jgi:hypothetical protein
MHELLVVRVELILFCVCVEQSSLATFLVFVVVLLFSPHTHIFYLPHDKDEGEGRGS